MQITSRKVSEYFPQVCKSPSVLNYPARNKSCIPKEKYTFLVIVYKQLIKHLKYGSLYESYIHTMFYMKDIKKTEHCKSS